MLSGGQIHDSKIAISLLETVNIHGSRIIADRAYGSEEIREYIIQHNAAYVIPPKRNTKEPWYVDWHLYKERHLVECFFHFIRVFPIINDTQEHLGTLPAGAESPSMLI